MTIQGLFTALITPFTRDGTVCEKTLSQLLEKQCMACVDGITILGTTGEAATLDDQERRQITKKSVEICKGNVSVMVGCTSPSTKTCVEFAKKATDDGADMLLIATPYYNKPTQEGIFAHFSEVCKHTDLPICVYNIPSRCGQNIETKTLTRLFELKNIVSVKEASGSLAQVQDVIESISTNSINATLLSGDDLLTLPLMALGAHGVVSVISNLLPHTMKRLVTSMRENNIDEARALHYALKPLIQACFIETNPIPIKRMLKHSGIDVGACRMPLVGPDKAHDDLLDQILQTHLHLISEEVYA